MIRFEEIPSDGEQFELFCRDVLQSIGLTVLTPPNRGSDGGRDLLVSELRAGVVSSTGFRWLVSCKHFAHSKRSVGLTDEVNIQDRVQGFGAHGFLGFYSTIASSGLVDSLERLQSQGGILEYQIYDHRRIESTLLARSLYEIMARFTPESYGSTRPLAKLWDEYVPLRCAVCDKDLLDLDVVDQSSAILSYCRDIKGSDGEKIKSVTALCKGRCDQIWEQRLQRNGDWSSWIDISDLCIPSRYADYIIAIFHESSTGKFYAEALEQLSQIMRALAQRTMRMPTPKDIKDYNDLLSFPSL